MVGKNRYTQFFLKGLERMFIPSEHVFSASDRLSVGQMINLTNHFFRREKNDRETLASSL